MSIIERTHYLPLKYPFMTCLQSSYTKILEKVAKLLSVAECNNRLLHSELFHKNVSYKTHVCCDTIFVKKFQMNQPVVTFGTREWPVNVATAFDCLHPFLQLGFRKRKSREDKQAPLHCTPFLH